MSFSHNESWLCQAKKENYSLNDIALKRELKSFEEMLLVDILTDC